MKDITTIARVKLLHPKFIPQVTAFIEEVEDHFGLTMRVVQGLRTFAEQDAIYAEGRTSPGKIVTQARGGSSYHNYGIAIDLVPFNSDMKTLDWNFDFSKLKPFATTAGLQCGMDFPHPDEDHFENKFSHNWRDLLVKYQSKDFIPGTTFVNI